MRSIPACTGEPRFQTPRPFNLRVYPRVYGGTQWYCPPGPPSSRSIPACTGEPAPKSLFRGGVTVYPRVYGGTAPTFGAHPSVIGLSPRVRGNPQFLTPPAPWRQVYPRVYGGTIGWVIVVPGQDGLSPRVRGNLDVPNFYGRVNGSIPACTGEPQHPSEGFRCSKVYPRVYGGTPGWCGCQRYSRGLSPRVRGNHPVFPFVQQMWRSIPACTGEPFDGGGNGGIGRVYPRVYGGTWRRFLGCQAGSARRVYGGTLS